MLFFSILVCYDDPVLLEVATILPNSSWSEVCASIRVAIQVLHLQFHATGTWYFLVKRFSHGFLTKAERMILNYNFIYALSIN